jgi:quercetin dioxygenase-like cupin family protein
MFRMGIAEDGGYDERRVCTSTPKGEHMDMQSNIRSGDVIENLVTGERLTFLKAAADTAGDYVLVEAELRPDAAVAAAHVHPFQTEAFEVLEGLVELTHGRKKIIAGPGEAVTVEPGRRHRFANAGDGPARFRCEVRPALGFERFIETLYGLAADEKTSKKGLPSPLRLAVIANAHFDDVRLPYVPASLQKLALGVGAAAGRLLGYEPTYTAEPAGGQPILRPA